MVKLYTISLDETEWLVLEETAHHPEAPNQFTTRVHIALQSPPATC